MLMVLGGTLRSYCVRFITISLLITGVMTAFSPAAFADEDEAVKKLVGKWEGNIAIPDGARTVVIDRVKREGDQWTAIGMYGVTGKDLRKVTYQVTVNGNDVQIEFTFGSNYLKLKLVGDNELDGTFRYFRPAGQGGGRQSNAQMKLKKAE